MERSLYWYMENLRILTNAYTTALTTEQVAKKMCFPPCLIEHIPLSHMQRTYTKNKAIVKRVVKIRKAFLVKPLRELLTIAACLSQSNKRKPQIS